MLLFFSLEIPSLPAAIFVVNNTADTGPGSLRQAILDSNATVPGQNEIHFNIPGPAPYEIFPRSPLPDITIPVIINGQTQPGFVGTPIIGIDGSGAGPANGLSLTTSNCIIEGLAITDFQTDPSLTLFARTLTGNGILINSGGYHLIIGNYLGVDPSGTGIGFGNIGDGIRISDSWFNKIGSSGSLYRNVVVDNGRDEDAIPGSEFTFAHGGITIWGLSATNNVVIGNYVGLDAFGNSLGNYNGGIRVAADYNVIGGTDPGAGNVISGNRNFGGFRGYGIDLRFHNCDISCPAASYNQILGNLIGTDPSGLVAIGNDSSGIIAESGVNNFIGGASAAARNVVSGNGLDGISITAGYPIIGILIRSSNNIVQGNYIGVDITGAPMGNIRDGINDSNFTENDPNNTLIGGTEIPGLGNTIAYNGRNGVTVQSGLETHILSNSIFDNVALGIDLGGDGVTENDPCDADSGANALQNFPDLNDAVTDGSHIAISGSLNSEPNKQYLLQFFWSDHCDLNNHGEGRVFIGQLNVTTDVSCNATFANTFEASVPPFKSLTATATSPDKNTSEFSFCKPIANPPPMSGSFSDGGMMSLSWPTNLVGWVLQSTPNLNPPKWQDDPSKVGMVKGMYIVVETFKPEGAMFRLRSP
jgi:hypothetical protein